MRVQHGLRRLSNELVSVRTGHVPTGLASSGGQPPALAWSDAQHAIRLAAAQAAATAAEALDACSRHHLLLVVKHLQPAGGNGGKQL